MFPLLAQENVAGGLLWTQILELFVEISLVLVNLAVPIVMLLIRKEFSCSVVEELQNLGHFPLQGFVWDFLDIVPDIVRSFKEQLVEFFESFGWEFFLFELSIFDFLRGICVG